MLSPEQITERAEFQKEVMQKVKDGFADELAQIRAASAQAAVVAAANIQSMKESHESTVRMLLERREEATADKPKTKWADKLSEKSYKRIIAFGGGEASWQDWKYDFQILTGSLQKDVAEELEFLLSQPEPRLNNELQELVAKGPNDWEPEKRRKNCSKYQSS